MVESEAEHDLPTATNQQHGNKWWKNITIEPIYACFCFTDFMCKFFYQNLLLAKTCYPDFLNEPTEIDRNCTENKSASADVASLYSYFISPAQMIAVLITVFALTWSDKAGNRRKPILMIPLLGLLLESAHGIFQSYFWHWPVTLTLIPYSVTQALLGGRSMFAQAAYLYLTDVTTTKNRTARFSLMATVRCFCLPISTSLQGLLLKRAGLFYGFLLCFSISFLSVILFIWQLPDYSNSTQKQVGFSSFIKPKNIIDPFRIIFRKRLHGKRLIIVLVLLIYNINSFINEGESAVLYLYFLNIFKWDAESYSFFYTYKLISSFVGSLIGTFFLIKRFKWTDGKILVTSNILEILTHTGFIFATDTWQFYTITAFDCFHLFSIITARSLISKLVEKTEYGTLSAVLSMTKISTPLSYALYSAIYSNTVKSFPRCFILISSFMAVVLCLLSCMSSYKYRKCLKTENSDPHTKKLNQAIC